MKSKLKIEQIGEFGLIEKMREMLFTDRRVVKGIGDDCAVLRSAKKGWYDLLTIDTIVEGVHFEQDTPPQKIGWKALAVNINDISAMGGIPSHAVVSLGIPHKYQVSKISDIYRGMKKIALKYKVNIVGGDTIYSPERLIITIALTGSVEKKNIAYRSGARPGDVIFVTGTLGGSILGRHLTFLPRLDEAGFLTRNFRINSMIDLSDGLASDIKRIAEASGHGALIDAGRIPVSASALKHSMKCKKSPVECALTDGEDFELLFTIHRKHAGNLAKKWEKRFKLKLTEIGEITREPDIKINDNKGKISELHIHGYDHFR